MFKKIIIILLLSAALNANGQMADSYRYADSLTYSLYNEKRWDELIKEGQEIVKGGLDYYYLRMRIGIAFYEKHNYVMSSIHFSKALEFNDNDQIALEYLFYSYFLAGNNYQAWALMSFFYPQNRERILRESRIKKNSLSIESFFSDAGTDNILNDPDSYFTNPEPGGQIATEYFINNSLYASHIFGNHFGYFHSYTNLLKENYLHYFSGTHEAHLVPQRIKQNQYYGSFSFFSSTGWVISPSFHFLAIDYPLIYITTTGMNTSVDTYKVKSNGFHTGIAVTKSIGLVVVGAETGYLKISTMQRLSGTVSLMFYPAGNSNFYIGGKISTGKELKNSSADLGIVEGFTAGFSVAGKVWIELSGITGDMNYHTSENGLYIYNSPDILKNKLNGTIIIPVRRAGLTFFAGGGFSSYSSEFIPVDGMLSFESNKLSYNSINFTGGISWNF